MAKKAAPVPISDLHYRKPFPMKPTEPQEPKLVETAERPWRRWTRLVYTIGVWLFIVMVTCSPQSPFTLGSRSWTVIINTALSQFGRSKAWRSSPRAQRITKFALVVLAMLMLFARSSLSIQTDPEVYKRGLGAYAVLEVPVNVDPGKLKSAYRELSKTLHPDKIRDSDVDPDDNGDGFETVSVAYNTLKKPLYRALYDRLGVVAATGPNLKGENLVKEFFTALQAHSTYYLLRILGELAVMLLTWQFNTRRVSIIAITSLVEQLVAGNNVRLLKLPSFQVARLLREAGLQSALLAAQFYL